MPAPLLARLASGGFQLPDYEGGGLLNVASSVLDVLGAREAHDPPPLRGLRADLRDGARAVLVILADGLGHAQLLRLCDRGATPFLAGLVERARAGDGPQLVEATSVFPSTTAAAITTLHTARSPQEHGNIAYFLWLDEFAQVAQMLRWGPGAARSGSFFDDPGVDPSTFAHVRSIHARLRARGGRSYVVEPEIFRGEAMMRMHAAESEHVGYVLPSSLGVRIAQLRQLRVWRDAPTYIYAYWSGVDAAAHQHGPGSPEHDAEAAALDLTLTRAFASPGSGDLLVLLTADHGHAAVDPERLVDLEGDQELRALLRNPIAGEPRCVFLHTDDAARVTAYLDHEYPGAFFAFDRDEAIAAGLFGRGDPGLVRRRVGEVCAMLGDDRGAVVVRIEGQVVRHRGSHGGMTPAEMAIPVLAWRV